MHEGFATIDAAAMHPSLSRGCVNYYKKCQQQRNILKQILAAELQIPHDLYIVSNTTHALLTVAYGLVLEGILLHPGDDSYTPYKILRPYILTITSGSPLPLLTHINPESGTVKQLLRCDHWPVVCDAAQSFGTTGFHDQSMESDVFLAPLHKHVGLACGLGLIGIKPTTNLPRLRAVAKMAESGTSDLVRLSQASVDAGSLRGMMLNRFVIEVETEQVDALAAVGITLRSPHGTSLPFAVLEGVDLPSLSRALVGTPYSMKYVAKTGLVRVSGAVRGHIDDLVDNHAGQIVSLLLRAHATRTR